MRKEERLEDETENNGGNKFTEPTRGEDEMRWEATTDDNSPVSSSSNSKKRKVSTS
jgi:hypothetical protein